MRRSTFFLASASAAALAASCSAVALADPVTFTLNDAEQRFVIPPGQALLIQSIQWQDEPEATHELVSLSASGFGPDIQIFPPANSDNWQGATNIGGIFLAATNATPQADVLVLTNPRVDWRDAVVSGHLLDVDDVAAWDYALGWPPIFGQNYEAVTITLNDANPSYDIPEDARFITRTIFRHLEGDARGDRLGLVLADGAVTSIDLTADASTSVGNVAIEPGNPNIVSFVMDSEAAGVTRLSLIDGVRDDQRDISISGFLITQEDDENGDEPDPEEPGDGDPGDGCAVPDQLVGAWRISGQHMEQNGVQPPQIMALSGGSLVVECDGSYVEDWTGAHLEEGPDSPPIPIPYTECDWLQGGSSGNAAIEGAGVRFTPSSAPISDQVDCGYAVNQFGTHVHAGMNPWVVGGAGDDLTLTQNMGPFAIIMSYERQ